MLDTEYLVGYCERQRHLDCNVMSLFFFAASVMIIFVSQCVIYACPLYLNDVELTCFKIKSG